MLILPTPALKRDLRVLSGITVRLSGESSFKQLLNLRSRSSKAISFLFVKQFASSFTLTGLFGSPGSLHVFSGLGDFKLCRAGLRVTMGVRDTRDVAMSHPVPIYPW